MKLLTSICILISTVSLLGEATLFVYPDVFNDVERDQFVTGSFPDSFQFGTATAAFQIEGAWNVDGKGPSIWDVWTHDPGHVYNGENADDADKSYYLWERDVEMMQELGAKFYRYSFSWPRIIPNGIYGSDEDVNWDGVKFYNETVNKIVAAGIEPMVTLFHWDLPQALQDKGGQIVEEFPSWFGPYADLCFKLFGDRVKHWITFNEPQTVANCFEYGNCAPGQYMPGVGSYLVIHRQLLAHQTAYHIYDNKYRASQKGNVGITICAGWCEPASTSQSDIDSSMTQMQFQIGWLMSPLIGTGNYPQVMIDSVALRSKQQGYEESRLPAFSDEEQQLLLGATDFFGLNYYSAAVCTPGNFSTDPTPSMYDDQNVISWLPTKWPGSASNWLRSCPYGIRRMLNWVQDNYNNFETPWYITENGYSAPPKLCNDTLDVNKTQYMVSHIDEVYKAVVEDGVNLQRYTFWSLMDNFEWDDGYSKKFGVYCVDFNDVNRTRSPRYSANVYANIIRNNGFGNQSLIEELESYGIITSEGSKLR